MYIQYNELGFELTTLEHESTPIITRPGLLPYLICLFCFPDVNNL